MPKSVERRSPKGSPKDVLRHDLNRNEDHHSHEMIKSSDSWNAHICFVSKARGRLLTRDREKRPDVLEAIQDPYIRATASIQDS